MIARPLILPFGQQRVGLRRLVERKAGADRALELQLAADREPHQRRKIMTWPASERAKHLELASHEPGDLDFGGQADGRDANHHAASTISRGLGRLTEGPWMPDCLKRDVDARSVGKIARRLHRIVVARH